MAQSSTLYVGLEVPKASIAVASTAKDYTATVVDLGSVGTRQCDSDKRVRQRPAKATRLVFVYAAGPCGSWLYRSLPSKGYACWVVAPSMSPQKAGDRVKTDRREALQLARLMRSGDLPPVSVPQVEDEAMRDLGRARDDGLRDRNAAQVRLQAFWRRHDLRDTGQASWNPAHRRWLSEVVCPPPAQHIGFQASGRTLHAPPERLQRLAQDLHAQGKAWRLTPVGAARQALRGVPCTGAGTTVAALGDLTRFEHPRPRMGYVGLPPAASSSGERRRQGASTTAGKTHARRALVAGAWA